MFRYMRGSRSDNKFKTTPQNTGPTDTEVEDLAVDVNNNKPSLSLSPLGPHDEDEDAHGGTTEAGDGFVTFDSPFPNVDQLKDDELPTWKEVMVKVNSCGISCSARGHEAAAAATMAATGKGGTSEITRNCTAVTEDTVDTSIEGRDREQAKDDVDPYSEDFMEDLFPALADETTTMETTGAAAVASDAIPRNSSNLHMYSGSVAGFSFSNPKTIDTNDVGTGSAFATSTGNEVEVTAAVDGLTLPANSSQFKPIKDDSSSEEKEVNTSLSSYYKNMLAVKNYLSPSSKDRKSNGKEGSSISSNTNPRLPLDDEELLFHPNSNEVVEEEAATEEENEKGVGNRTSSTTSSKFRFETIYTEEKDIIIDMVEDPATQDRLDGASSEGAVGGGVSVAQNAGSEYHTNQDVSKRRSGTSNGVAMNIGIELGSDDDFEIVAGGGSTNPQNENEKSLKPNIDCDEKHRGRFSMLVAGLLCLLLTICAIALGVGLSKDKDGQSPSPAVSANAATTSPPAITFTRPPASATSSSPTPVSAPTIPPAFPATTASPTLEPTNQPVFSPTDVPTSQPTAVPTPPPTAATVSPTNPPTEVQCNEDTISVSQACVNGQNSIIIDFSVCNPTGSDWIGLYSDNTAAVVSNGDGTYTIDASYYDWVFTCGDKNCPSAPSSNSFALPINNPALDQIPLRVYLNREGNGQTWDVVAQSQAFVLTNPCG